MLHVSPDLTRQSSTGGKVAGIFSPQRRSVLLIFISAFFFCAAIYFYAPVLPVYAQSLGGSLTAVGIIGAAYGLPQLLVRIPISIWSDSMGRRKPFIIGGIIMVLVGSIGLWISPNLWLLSFSRGIVGVGAATWVLFVVYTVSFYLQDNMAQAVGILGFIFSAAVTVTTLVGGIVTDFWGEKAAFIAAALLAFAALIPALFATEIRVTKTEAASWKGFSQIARRPLLIVVSIMGILLFFAEFASIWGFVPVYAHKIGASATELGVLTMLSSGVSMAGSLIVAPTIKRCGNVLTLILGASMLGLSLLVVPFIHNIPILDAVMVLNGLGWGMIPTQLTALSIHNTLPQQRATAMGFFQAMYAIGMLTGPLVSGFVADTFGLALIFYISAGVCLVVVMMAFLPVLPRRQS